jgi:hypothetical protein
VLCYKTNIKHFFRADIQLYQHSWKLGKLEIVFPNSTRVDITVYQHGKCFIFVKYNHRNIEASIMLYRNNMRTPVLSILYPQTANLDSKTEDLGMKT